MKRLLPALALALCAAPAPARADAVSLPFTRTHLPNGLELIVHEDHTVPVVAVDVWYHVGSKDERPGRTGFAHLFEHLMFQGSAHVADKMHFKFITEAGGWANGTTNRDRTNFLEVVPSNFLERAMWLESDRMGFLMDTMTQAKLDNQRDVVRNERRQNYENRPYGAAIKQIAASIFPPAHPYHWLTIGEHADLQAASMDDVRAFFRKYYVPANATLSIAGDVDTRVVQQLAARWFGPLPGGQPQPMPKAPPLPHLDAVKQLSITDRVALERLYLVWPSPAHFKPGDAELDLLAAILGTKSGRLYRRLVYESRLAQSVHVSQSSDLLASEFEVVVTAKPGHTAAEMLPIVDEELRRLRTEPVTDRELERAKNSIEADLTYDLMSVGGFSGRADRLAMYAYFAGDPGFYAKDLARFREVTAQSIRSTVDKTLGPGRLELTVTPARTAATKEESK